jgi:DNA-directed RNA polymerase specialized sigma24 family protein
MEIGHAHFDAGCCCTEVSFRRNTVGVRDDERAFAELYRRWRPGLHGYFLRRIGRWHAADELESTVLTELFRKRFAYPEGCPVRSWFFAFARTV